MAQPITQPCCNRRWCAKTKAMSALSPQPIKQRCCRHQSLSRNKTSRNRTAVQHKRLHIYTCWARSIVRHPTTLGGFIIYLVAVAVDIEMKVQSQQYSSSCPSLVPVACSSACEIDLAQMASTLYSAAVVRWRCWLAWRLPPR